MNIIELAKQSGFPTMTDYGYECLERLVANVRAERKWVDLTNEDRNEIETKLCPHIDSHDFETIGNAYIAAFKEKN